MNASVQSERCIAAKLLRFLDEKAASTERAMVNDTDGKADIVIGISLLLAEEQIGEWGMNVAREQDT